MTRHVGVMKAEQHLSSPSLGSRRFYYVSEAGNTGGAHQEWLDGIRRRGQIEVYSPEQSDYLLVFCPVVSRVGTDIQEALKNSPGRSYCLG